MAVALRESDPSDTVSGAMIVSAGSSPWFWPTNSLVLSPSCGRKPLALKLWLSSDLWQGNCLPLGSTGVYKAAAVRDRLTDGVSAARDR